MLEGLYILDTDAFNLVYSDADRIAIQKHVRFAAGHMTKQSIAANAGVLQDVELIFSGWGMPIVDDAFLLAAPRLKAIFYAAGAIGSWITSAVIDRGIQVTTAHVANSLPVAEYTLAMTLLSLKHTFQLAHQTRLARSYPDRNSSPGAYGSTIGLISFGVVAELLREKLRAFDVKVIVYDPFLSAREAARNDMQWVTLEELFTRSDVVSLHTPLFPETMGLITGAHLASMKLGATFINTARGPVVREEEMLDVLQRRHDLQAILDVAAIEPPAPHSRIYTLPNVLHTPHIAGSVGGECRRMGHQMTEELGRYVRGEPLVSAIDFNRVDHTSNQPSRNYAGTKTAATY